MMRILLTLLLISSTGWSATSEDDVTGNLRFNLAALAQKSVQFDVDFRYNPKWTLGPSISFFNSKYPIQPGARFVEDHTISGYGVAIRANYYPKGIWQSGWYAEASLNYITATVTNRDTFNITASSTPSGLLAIGGGGYHWFWDPVNVSVGMRLGYPLKPVVATLSTTTAMAEDVPIVANSFYFTGLISLGFAF